MPLQHPNFDPIAFSTPAFHIPLINLDVSSWPVHWYGIMYAVAFAQFLILGRLRAKQPHNQAAGWTKDDLDDMLFYGVLGVFFGGRLGEVILYHPAEYFAHPVNILKVWNGGMSFHGGFVGVLVAMSLWAHKRKRNVMAVLDFIAPLVPLGYAAGRFGNFINHELPGRPADPSLPWAMWWPGIPDHPVHPSPLYQMLIDGVLLFIILWPFARKPKPLMAVSGMFSLLYGCARCFTEFYREPDYTVYVGSIPITAGQLWSLPMIVLGIVLLVIAYRKPGRTEHNPAATPAPTPETKEA